MEYYSAIKKNEILPFATMWMEPGGIMLSQIRERQISYDFTHMRTLRHRTGEHKGSKNNIKTGSGTKHKRQIWRTNRGLLEGGWAKWGRGIKESTPEIIVAPCVN